MSAGQSRRTVIGLLVGAAVAGFASTTDAATGLAVLAIATIPALFAVPARGRPVLGVAVAGAGLTAAILGDFGGGAAWTSAAALGAAGVLTVARGGSWTGLARRYDDGVGPDRGDEPHDLWRALDRGEDPTLPDRAGDVD